MVCFHCFSPDFVNVGLCLSDINYSGKNRENVADFIKSCNFQPNTEKAGLYFTLFSNHLDLFGLTEQDICSNVSSTLTWRPVGELKPISNRTLITKRIITYLFTDPLAVNQVQPCLKSN